MSKLTLLVVRCCFFKFYQQGRSLGASLRLPGWGGGLATLWALAALRGPLLGPIFFVFLEACVCVSLGAPTPREAQVVSQARVNPKALTLLLLEFTL